ncbi:RNA polymerase sigma factor [bacterium]|nr:RNA polymerase sigma factor [bacterium]
MDRSDRELITAIKNNDPDAARVLYERYYAMTVRVALKVLHSTDDAQDIAQEVFMRVLVRKKILAFRGDSQLGSWLYKVTVNHSLSFIRKKMKRQETQRLILKECREFNSRTSENVDQLWKLETHEKLEHLCEALDTLPGLYGKCLFLRYYEGQKYKEIAKKLKITRDRVGMQIMRSRNLLNKNQELKKLYVS